MSAVSLLLFHSSTAPMEVSFLIRPPTTSLPSAPYPTSLALRRSPRRVSASARADSPTGQQGKRLFFALGMGYVARHVSQRLMEEERNSWDIHGTCTSTLKKGLLEDAGFKAYTFNAPDDRLEKLDSLRDATHLLVSTPPLPSLGDPFLGMLEDLQNVLGSGNLRWLCYLSSTSVYGDCQGAFVSEDYPANPASNAAKARLSAEKGWLDLGSDLCVPSYVFRLGGAYGPGRSALNTVLKGNLLSENQRNRWSKQFTARVHVEDIYQAIKSSFCLPMLSSGIFNIVDDDPAPRSEVFAFAKDLLKEKFPGRIEGDDHLSNYAQHSDAPEAIHKGEKRVSNARLKKDLGVNLSYPSYREGLQHILASL